MQDGRNALYHFASCKTMGFSIAHQTAINLAMRGVSKEVVSRVAGPQGEHHVGDHIHQPCQLPWLG